LQIIIFVIMLLTANNLGEVKMTQYGDASKIVIYTTGYCPYCVKAKRLLDQKDVSYQEINVENNLELREELVKKSGGRKTVPQIFINDQHIGGCDDLYALEDKNELDKIIGLK
jgi:glutaredoxin 3